MPETVTDLERERLLWNADDIVALSSERNIGLQRVGITEDVDLRENWALDPDAISELAGDIAVIAFKNRRPLRNLSASQREVVGNAIVNAFEAGFKLGLYAGAEIASWQEEVIRGYCIDCGEDTTPWPGHGRTPPPAGRWEHFMVTDEIWAAAGLTVGKRVGAGGRVCVGCLEDRLGRQLCAADFERGEPSPQDTPRLADRKQRNGTPASGGGA